MKRHALYAAKIAGLAVLGVVVVRRIGVRWVLKTLALGVLDEVQRIGDSRE